MLSIEEKKVRQREATYRWREKNREQHLATAREQARRNRQRPERKAYMKEYLARYYQENREKFWGYRGVKCTAKMYGQLIQEQDNKCAICYAEPDKRGLAVDHDHNTGVIRGLLCHNCNLLIGNACDNPEILHSAITYLRKVSN